MASSSCSLFLKRPHEAGRMELCIEDVQELTVQKLMDKVAEKMGLPLKEFRLVYAGRVLKTGKTTQHYKIVSGCTIYVLRTPPPKQKGKVSEERSRAGASSLLSNRRVLRAICRILSNPGLLRSMIQGTQLANNEVLIRALGNRQLIAELSNPDSLQEYLGSYPQMAMMMENIIRVYGLLYGGLTGDTIEEEQEIIDMVERNFEDDLEDADQENISSPLAQAQEQMFEHSQALHAHQQQRQSHPAHSSLHHPQPGPTSSSSSHQPLAQRPAAVAQESSFNPSSSQQVPRYQRQHSAGGSITQQQLASALAGAMGSVHSSPLSSLNFSDVQTSSHSAPSSLTSDQILQPPPSASGPSHGPHPTAPPTYVSTVRAGSGSDRSRRVQANGSTTSGRGRVTGQATGSVTGDVLQQALANAFSTIQTPSRAAQDSEGGLTPRQRYAAHLIQLHSMGISDDAACLQALEATGGDLEAALEILYSK